MQVKEFSPMVAKIDIYKYGSNQLRKKMNHIPGLELSKTKVSEPKCAPSFMATTAPRKVTHTNSQRDNSSDNVMPELKA